MKKIGIIGAMDVEIEYLCSIMENGAKKTQIGRFAFEEGKIHGVDVVLSKSGIGKVNAALCAQLLCMNFGCTNLINTGIAGAMGSGLGIMDFVISTEAVYHDVDVTEFGYKPGQIPQIEVSAFKADEKMVEAFKKVFADNKLFADHKTVAGRIASGDQFISDKNLKEKIKSLFSPACVEMEGCAIAHACYLHNVPFVIIRCLSDMAEDAKANGYDFNEDIAANLSAKAVEAVLTEI